MGSNDSGTYRFFMLGKLAVLKLLCAWEADRREVCIFSFERAEPGSSWVGRVTAVSPFEVELSGFEGRSRRLSLRDASPIVIEGDAMVTVALRWPGGRHAYLAASRSQQDATLTFEEDAGTAIAVCSLGDHEEGAGT